MFADKLDLIGQTAHFTDEQNCHADAECKLSCYTVATFSSALNRQEGNSV